jgi:hypothetical protein
VQTAFAASPIHALRQLRVESQDHTLLLHGRVSSFYYKQLAQEVARSFADGFRVINSVGVGPASDDAVNVPR